MEPATKKRFYKWWGSRLWWVRALGSIWSDEHRWLRCLRGFGARATGAAAAGETRERWQSMAPTGSVWSRSVPPDLESYPEKWVWVKMKQPVPFGRGTHFKKERELSPLFSFLSSIDYIFPYPRPLSVSSCVSELLLSSSLRSLTVW